MSNTLDRSRFEDKRGQGGDHPLLRTHGSSPAPSGAKVKDDRLFLEVLVWVFGVKAYDGGVG